MKQKQLAKNLRGMDEEEDEPKHFTRNHDGSYREVAALWKIFREHLKRNSTEESGVSPYKDAYAPNAFVTDCETGLHHALAGFEHLSGVKVDESIHVVVCQVADAWIAVRDKVAKISRPKRKARIPRS
jgi:hypothetical protein